jgi:hypothetical protein
LTRCDAACAVLSGCSKVLELATQARTPNGLLPGVLPSWNAWRSYACGEGAQQATPCRIDLGYGTRPAQEASATWHKSSTRLLQY